MSFLQFKRVLVNRSIAKRRFTKTLLLLRNSWTIVNQLNINLYVWLLPVIRIQFYDPVFKTLKDKGGLENALGSPNFGDVPYKLVFRVLVWLSLSEVVLVHTAPLTSDKRYEYIFKS